MSFSDYLEDAVLDEVFSKAVIPTFTLYVALWVGDPGEIGIGGAEVSGGSYARVFTLATVWHTALGGVLTNEFDITFPEATASWGTVTHFAILDAPSGGHLLMYGVLAVSKAIATGSIPRFAGGTPGELVISLS